MSFRARLTLVAAVAVAVAVAILSVTTYLIARDVLYGQVDTALQEKAREAVLRDTPAGFVGQAPRRPARDERYARADRPGAATTTSPCRPDRPRRRQRPRRRGRPSGGGLLGRSSYRA